MPPALWLVILPLGAAPLVYLLRRTGIGALVAAGVSLVTAWLSLRLPIGSVLTLLGRSFELDRLTQITLTLLFVTAAALFLAAFPFAAPGQNRVDRRDKPGQGRNFRVAGLVTLSIFVAANLSRHVGITAMLMEMAVIAAIFTIQGRRVESTRAAQRFLVLLSLAVPLFLLAAWQIDRYQLAGLPPAEDLQQTALFIGFGFALWLAVAPFHGWLTSSAAEAAPPAAAFVLLAFPLVALSILMRLLTAAPWLAASTALPGVILLAGVFTALVGGLLAAVQRGFSHLWGYAALYDLGCTLAVLGLGGETVVVIVLAGLTVRALALSLIAACLSALRLHTAYDGFAEIEGLARRLPVATAGLVIGGLTLAGAPLTLGFPLRWHLLQAITGVDSRWPVLLALAGLGVAVGYLRGLRALLRYPSSQKERPAVALQEPLLLVIMIGLLGAACLVLGLFPWLLLEPLQSLLAGVVVPLP